MELLNVLKGIPEAGIIAILIVIAGITLIMIFNYVKNRKLQGIREDVYQFILMAEHKFRSGEGKKKLNWVVSQAEQLLPSWMRFFVSDDLMIKMIDTWFSGVKDLLDDGKMNKSSKKDVIPDETKI